MTFRLLWWDRVIVFIGLCALVSIAASRTVQRSNRDTHKCAALVVDRFGDCIKSNASPEDCVNQLEHVLDNTPCK